MHLQALRTALFAVEPADHADRFYATDEPIPPGYPVDGTLGYVDNTAVPGLVPHCRRYIHCEQEGVQAAPFIYCG
ncbi:MAG TPA: hypothetical protein VLT62_22325 [Candidatus Methylomirabilis sp.]|nr:hypothetical protein [Candidatus Methylomirabilis sp.]